MNSNAIRGSKEKLGQLCYENGVVFFKCWFRLALNVCHKLPANQEIPNERCMIDK